MSDIFKTGQSYCPEGRLLSSLNTMTSLYCSYFFNTWQKRCKKYQLYKSLLIALCRSSSAQPRTSEWAHSLTCVGAAPNLEPVFWKADRQPDGRTGGRAGFQVIILDCECCRCLGQFRTWQAGDLTAERVPAFLCRGRGNRCPGRPLVSSYTLQSLSLLGLGLPGGTVHLVPLSTVHCEPGWMDCAVTKITAWAFTIVLFGLNITNSTSSWGTNKDTTRETEQRHGNITRTWQV